MLCVLWQKDCVALCQAELLSRGFSEMSKICWLGTASPPFASLRTKSFENYLREFLSNLLAFESLTPL